MCYYNGQKVSHAEFIRLMNLEKEVAKYDFLNQGVQNAFNHGQIAVIVPTEDKTNFDIGQMEWGFIPAYIKNREQATNMRRGYKNSQGKYIPPYHMMNAIGKELLDPGKVWNVAAREHRCLILSSGFYEYQHVYRKNKKTGADLKTPDTYPYHITVKESDYFYIAGVWQYWKDQTTGEVMPTVALVTTEANGIMKQIHNSKNRMPTILPDDLAWEWLMGDLNDERIIELATYQISSKEMEACTVSKEFRDALDPAVPFAYEGLAALDLSIE
ncbi:SOS response-associated peptidase [Pedobacter sp. GR22-10]|uniref:SOS response-associated peptidase n=1 Tax=Pedobacter sp. GR22-10 TaxID=2994472 RepID=UPI0022458BF5|nr:SOS response-associated peptidase family protein [Pedobacter sp. GR22-10]MCX2429885.1 SOS response-associated peptidase family protein [Pedobacter sp. GR22-10]